LIPSIVGEKNPESMYFQIVDARIHDMRGKIPNDKRSHGKIYLENTQMAAGFQFKQREKSGICAQETAQMRAIAHKYVKHHMVPFSFNMCHYLIQ
jgi:hypothetical protein